MSRPTEAEARFVAYLEALVEGQDRASLAALRRGLGKPPGSAAELHRYVVPWLPDDAAPWQEAPYYLVAALFAWHQGSWKTGDGEHQATDFGASFARLAENAGGESVEKRFVALLNCHRDDLPEHVRQAVGLLKSKEVLIDWAQLLHDIKGWDWESRAVQREWARAFWRRGPADEGPAGEAPVTSESGSLSSQA